MEKERWKFARESAEILAEMAKAGRAGREPCK